MCLLCFCSPSAFCPSFYLSIHPCTIYLFGSYYSFQEGQRILPPKWDSLLLIKYFLSKLLPHPTHFLFLSPPILSFSSSSASHIIGFSTCRPSRLCLFFCFCFDIQETSNHFLNMFLEFQNCTVALTRLISMNQPLMAQAQRMTQEAHGRTTITQLETLL